MLLRNAIMKFWLQCAAASYTNERSLRHAEEHSSKLIALGCSSTAGNRTLSAFSSAPVIAVTTCGRSLHPYKL